jgi:hypothetical protein
VPTLNLSSGEWMPHLRIISSLYLSLSATVNVVVEARAALVWTHLRARSCGRRPTWVFINFTKKEHGKTLSVGSCLLCFLWFIRGSSQVVLLP